jgi:poly-gamma-glutamate synthesis protein (capsule biosynthesis protein)
MNRRSQERQKRQEARLKKERRNRIRLLAALGVLVACGLLIFFTSVAPEQRPATPTETTTEPVETEPVQTEVKPGETGQQDGFQPTTVITFAAAGDLNITDKVVASGGVNYDYTNAFMDVLPLLSKADLTALNLEGNVCGAPYGADSAPQQLLEALKAAGVDMLQLANSKAISRGVSGLNSTVRSVRAAGMAVVGAVAEGEEPGAYVIRYVDGVKVAVVSFTKGMDGMAMPVGSENLVNLLYTDYASTYKKVDTKAITSLLRKVQEEEPDITIALLHWGSEYSDVHSATQDSIRKLMLKEGVDAIIGTHPHFVQEMEFDQANGTFVAYSLGDFFGDAARSGTAYSVVLELEITKDNTTGVTKVTNFSYTPIYTVEDDTGSLRVLRLQEAINAYKDSQVAHVSDAVYNDMVYGMDRLEKRINPTKE